MGKRLLACLVCLALFAFSAVPTGADSESVLWELRGCSAVYAYSGKRAAYFFGFNGASLVSSRIFPDTVTRSAEAGGSIVLACHDESAAYALYRAGIGGYRALIMDMNSGACEDVAVAQGCAVQASSFAAADGELYVIAVENGASFVWAGRGAESRRCRLPGDIGRLFSRESNVYAELDDGSVYRVSGGAPTLCTDVPPGGTEPLSKAGTLSVQVGDRTAVLYGDGTCRVSDGAAQQSEEQPQGGQTAAPAGGYMEGGWLTVTAGTTVAQLKRTRGDVSAVTDGSGAAVTGGALRTGYWVYGDGWQCIVVVTGDVDGSGTVTSLDVQALMRYLTGCSLAECGRRAADLNGDGAADSRDLVLLARRAA